MFSNISILLPTFNCDKYISNAIQSILCQTFIHFELIVIDDGSTDDTGNLVNKIQDKRIQYVKIEHSGISGSLNVGLNIAKYDLIARMDADDLAMPDRLEHQINFIARNPSYDVVSSWYVTFKGKRFYHMFKLPSDHNEIVKGLQLHSTLCHPGTIFNKHTILSAGGYSNQPFEDYELWLRLKNKVKFYNIPKPLMLVRLRGDSLLRKGLKEKKQTMIYLQNKYFDNHVDYTNTEYNILNEYKLKGWREWFYGDKAEARRLWFTQINKIIFEFRILFAIILSFLPPKYFEYLKKLNLKARIHYLFILSKKDKKRLKDFIVDQL